MFHYNRINEVDKVSSINADVYYHLCHGLRPFVCVVDTNWSISETVRNSKFNAVCNF